MVEMVRVLALRHWQYREEDWQEGGLKWAATEVHSSCHRGTDKRASDTPSQGGKEGSSLPGGADFAPAMHYGSLYNGEMVLGLYKSSPSL